MKNISAFLSGLLFGIGLIISGMTDPSKVLGFLDIAGNWDPSLALVMLGAISVTSVGFWLINRRKKTCTGEPLQLPTATHIDRRLMLGSALFGAGWGVAGLCPGPALVLLGTGSYQAIIFVVSMLLGMHIFELLEKRRLSNSYNGG